MAGIIKGVVRIGVIGGLVVGGGILVAGPERVHAIGRQIQSKFVSAIDRTIEDPVAMRAQLRDLESKYPRRIADARAMLAELNEQARVVARDRAISERVVALAQSDLDSMKDLLVRAQSARDNFTGSGRQVISVAFNDQKLNLDAAYAQANRIADTVASYQTRIAEQDRELSHLKQDANQTEALLNKLEAEYLEFQTQLADLDRKIDTVSRKERMVAMMNDRQRRIDELSRYKAESLDQFKSSLANRLAQLDARLESLAGREDRVNYEERAKLEVDTAASARFRLDRDRVEQIEPPVSETVVGEDDAPAQSAREKGGRIAVR